MGFLRQEYWTGLPFLSPGHPPDPGIKPASPALAGRLYTEPSGKALLLKSTDDLVSIMLIPVLWATLANYSNPSRRLTTWIVTGVWTGVGGGGQPCRMEPVTYGIWCSVPVELSWITGHSAGVWELLAGVRKPPNSLYWTWVQNLLAVYKQPHSFRTRNISYATCVPTPFFLLRLFP